MKTPAEVVTQQFRAINKICDFKQTVNQFKKFDIYSDIEPYPETIVWLDGKENKEEGYINCSRIQSSLMEAQSHIIATQGP